MNTENPQPAKIKVSVAMTTYNHEAFVAQAIESVLMQQTTFEYELIIGEDFSTDGTRAVVLAYGERYPERIRLLLPERNQGASTNSAAVLDACRGQYIANLEGDDYWTDPYKLQKQVDFLENHLDCSACFHAVNKIYEDAIYPGEGSELFHAPGRRSFYGLDDLLIFGDFMATCSVVFRSENILNTPKWHTSLVSGDWALNLLIATKGKIGYIDETMGVYRIHSGGLWTSMSDRDHILNSILALRTAAKNLHLEHNVHLRRALSEQCYLLSVLFRQTGAVCKAVIPAVNSVLTSPSRERGTASKKAIILFFPRIVSLLFGLYSLFYRLILDPWASMKRKRKNAGGASWLLSSIEPEKSVDPIYEGYLDEVDYYRIRGWAWNASQPNDPIHVSLYCDDVILCASHANVLRLDLLAAGKGNGCHSFEFPVPFQLKNGKSHTIDVRISATDTKLTNSPKMVKWSPQIVSDFQSFEEKFRGLMFNRKADGWKTASPGWEWIHRKAVIPPIEWVKRFRKAYLERPEFLRSPWLWSLRQASLPGFVVPVIVQHKNGAKFFLSEDYIDDLVLEGIYQDFHGLYFPEQIAVPSNALFLDVGAHHGFYTIAALSRYAGIKVISVEPDPRSIKLLERNIKINGLQGRVEVIHAALGKKDGSGWLNYTSQSWGNYVGELGDNAIRVPVVSPETVLGSRVPFLVKCNSEGSEFEIIPRMFELNMLPKHILLFVHPEHGNEKDLIQTLEDKNYTVSPLYSSPDHPRYLCTWAGDKGFNA